VLGLFEILIAKKIKLKTWSGNTIDLRLFDYLQKRVLASICKFIGKALVPWSFLRQLFTLIIALCQCFMLIFKKKLTLEKTPPFLCVV